MIKSLVQPCSSFFIAKYTLSSSMPLAVKSVDIANPLLLQEVAHHANIFCANHSQQDDRHISWKSSSAATIELEFNIGENYLLIEGDPWGRAPVFYAQVGDVFLVSSHMQLLASFLPSLSEEKTAAADLSIQGYLSADKTPWREIKKLVPDYGLMVSPQKKWDLFALNKIPKNWFTEECSNEWLEEALRLLKISVLEIVENGFQYMAVSGGCDSRLILGLMPAEIRRQIQAYTKANSDLSLADDNDASIALELSKKLNLKHQILAMPENYKAFLIPELVDEMVISGLYGGEFLGGTLYDMLPRELITKFDFSATSIKELFLASFNSSRTILHDQVDFSWASPYTNLYYTQTPFLNPHFLNHLVKIDFNEMKDYKAYNKIWQKKELEDLAKIPFQSPLTFFFPFANRTQGKDPKNKMNSESSSFHVEQLAQDNLSFFRSCFRKNENFYL